MGWVARKPPSIPFPLHQVTPLWSLLAELHLLTQPWLGMRNPFRHWKNVSSRQWCLRKYAPRPNILQPGGIFEEEAAPLEAFAIRKAEHLQILVSGKEVGLDLRDFITASYRGADQATTSWAGLLIASTTLCLSVNKSGLSETWCISFRPPQGSKWYNLKVSHKWLHSHQVWGKPSMNSKKEEIQNLNPEEPQKRTWAQWDADEVNPQCPVSTTIPREGFPPAPLSYKHNKRALF